MNKAKKYMTITASIVFLLLTIVMLRRIPQPVDEPRGVEAPVGTVGTATALYLVVDEEEARMKYGVSAELSAESLGELICYLDRDSKSPYMASSYEETSEQTDITLYTVRELECDAVAILQDGKDYAFARMDHPYRLDYTQEQLFAEIFALYGIESGKDIASIFRMDNDGKLRGNVIDDEAQIEQFYTESLKMEQCSWEEFYHTYVTSSDSLRSQQQAKRLEKDRETLCIEAKNGLRFYLYVYDKRSWICCTMVDASFKMTNTIHDLLA